MKQHIKTWKHRILRDMGVVLFSILFLSSCFGGNSQFNNNQASDRFVLNMILENVEFSSDCATSPLSEIVSYSSTSSDAGPMPLPDAILGPDSTSSDSYTTLAVGYSAGIDRWTGGIVYYNIDPSVYWTSRITEGIAHIEAATNVRFQLRVAETDYITFTRATDPNICGSSSIGMVGGRQFLYLSDDSGCGSDTVVHELGHALGLLHEQQREDRNDYVTVVESNIMDGYLGNFGIYSGSFWSTYGAYDYSSIMHYHAYAFSKNGQTTIADKWGFPVNTQSRCLSTKDAAGLNEMYP